MQRKNRWKVALGMLVVALDLAALVAWAGETELLGLVEVGLPEVIGVSALAALITAWGNWSALRRLSPSFRFRELHIHLSRELRETREELGRRTDERRTERGLYVDRKPLALKLKDLGILSPNPQDEAAWLEFLVSISSFSERGNIRRARKAYGGSVHSEVWEQSKRNRANWSDPNMSPEVARSSVGVYLSLCRERVLSQENLNREYAVKATGVITFAATLFVFGHFLGRMGRPAIAGEGADWRNGALRDSNCCHGPKYDY